MSDELKVTVPHRLLEQAFLSLCDAAERCEYKGMTTTFRCPDELGTLMNIDVSARSPVAVAWDRCCDAMRPEERYGL